MKKENVDLENRLLTIGGGLLQERQNADDADPLLSHQATADVHDGE